PLSSVGYWKACNSPWRLRSSTSSSSNSTPSSLADPSAEYSGLPVSTWLRVDLPEPLGPMITWISPNGTTRSSPLRISLPSTEARRPDTSKATVMSALRSRERPRRLPPSRHRWGRAGWQAELAAHRCAHRKRSRAAGTPPRSRTDHPPTGRPRRDCSDLRWHTHHHRSGRERCGARRCSPASRGPEGCGASRRPRSSSRQTTLFLCLDESTEDRILDRAGHDVDREPVDHLGEEAADEHPLSPFSADAPALEVVEMLVFERSNRRPMATYDVVAQDLQIRNRMRLGVLGQHEVAVGLEGGGSESVLLDPKKACEHRLCLVFDRSLQENVGGGVATDVVDDHPVVEDLFVPTEIEADDLRRRSGSDQVDDQVEAAHLATQADLADPPGGVPCQPQPLMSEAGRGCPPALPRKELQAGALSGRQQHRRNGRRLQVLRAPVDHEHGCF